VPLADSIIPRLAVALGIGLLIGAERERHKGSGPGRAPAGIRTFALVALLGGVSMALGGEWILVVSVLIVGALAALGYRKGDPRDPGLTTEVALITAVLLGALAVREPAIAAGLAVVVAILLASRPRLHRFVRRVLSEQELHDALLLAAAALVILPLAPNRAIDPMGVFNPRTLWKLVVLVMAVGGMGHIALRAFGPRLGLPLAGLASGFVSSAATVGAMGERAARQPTLFRAAVAGAVLSTIATIVQMALLLATTDRLTLAAMAVPLMAAGAAAVVYGVIFLLRSVRHQPGDAIDPGRAFEPKTALLFALTVLAVLFVSAVAQRRLGSSGLLAAAALAGFADAHSAAVSAAALAAAGKLRAADTVLPILAALTTNSVTKGVLAASAGGRSFALRVIPGLVLVILAAWAGMLASI
jgi:uncharacterized membrane protein (DUF4010 family)